MSTNLPLIEDTPGDAIAPSARPDEDKPGCGQLETPSGERLPLKALTVDTRIVALTATSTVTQRFANTGDTTLEATYVFPLPNRAAVTEFTATLGGRRVVGMLKERGEARLDYEEALAGGQRAAIAEEDRSDVFSVRVGNLGSGEEATVQLVLTGSLAVEDSQATFRFPLVIAPRYSAGIAVPGDQTGAGGAPDTDLVPDASRVTPPRLDPTDARPELSVTVSVDGAGLAISDLRTSLHSAIVEAGPDQPTVVRLRPDERADRDFLLRFSLADRDLGSSAVLAPDPDGEEGTWSVTLIPPPDTAVTARDVVIVLDRSGSMDGWKMVAARRAAGRMVDMLDANDRFCVLAFDNWVETIPKAPVALVAATDRSRFSASSWLGSMSARGGTEMQGPLITALRLLAGTTADRQATVVLVTDGQVAGEDHLLKALGALVQRTRVHCVGIDRAVNAGFLDRLSRLGGGRCELVESEDRLDEAMTRLSRTIGPPSLHDIAVTATDVTLLEGTISPRRAPDAFAGVPCVLTGRYRAAGPNPVLAVRGTGVDSRFATSLLPKVTTAAAVRAVWARAVLRDLEDDYVSGHHADAGDASAGIVAHSIRFGVLSRFTAFVAVDPDRSADGSLDEVLQPVEYPSGWMVAGPAESITVGSALVAASPEMVTLERMATRMSRAAAPGAAARRLRPNRVPAPPALPDRISDLLGRLESHIAVGEQPLLAWMLVEMETTRDTVTEPALRAALDELCTALRVVVVEGEAGDPTAEALAALCQAIETVKGVLSPPASTARPTAPRRFWE